ncbi:hypothetical protein BSKO_13224 [Bryopsis sp. KO-2023]|nr:hypothetical protein BSKO_13224 [Bryopsis sp. KO-2023]
MRALVFAAIVTICGIIHFVNRRRRQRNNNLRQVGDEGEGGANNVHQHNRAESSSAEKVATNHDDNSAPASPTIGTAAQESPRRSCVLPSAQDLMSGGKLGSYFTAGQSRSLAVCRFIAANLLLQLEALHYRGVMHRDINMDRVNVDVSGPGFLFFGNLRHATSTRNTPRASPPDHRFMAPEIAYGWGEGMEADVWAFGVLVYRILIGRFPFPNFHQEDRGQDQGYVNLMWRVCSLLEGRPGLTNFFASIFQVKKEYRPTVAELKQHPFFRGVDWYGLAQRTVESPLLGEVIPVPIEDRPAVELFAGSEPCIE